MCSHMNEENKSNLSTPLIEYLNELFESRRKRNTRYSLRAFARDLNISVSKVSEVFSGKYAPGAKTVEKICEALSLSKEEAERFGALVRHHEMIFSERAGTYLLTEDELDMIVDFEYYSALALMEGNPCSDPGWIAERLGISVEKAFEIVGCLLRMGLLVMEDGHYKPTHKRVTTTHNIPSSLLKEAHRQLIDHARKSLEIDPVELRDITSMTFAVDKSRLPEIKKILRECRRKVAELCEMSPKDEVYNLNMQLVPVTRIQPQEKV